MPQSGPPQVIGNWWLGDKLGSGYSGSIHKATHIHTGQVAALKLQLVDHECPTNQYERTFYPHLQGGKGMPTLFGSGVQGEYDYLVIELLGQSLDSLFRKLGQKTMDLRSVCCVAMQLISRLECMHSRGVLHRDIQLGNCVIGLPPNQNTLYMIDFGFSKIYIDPRTREHIPDSKRKRDFIGNYWFSSVAVHCKGRVPTRRDDMEALALMLIHMLTPGGLSWTRNGVPKTDDAHEMLKREKRDAAPEDLCRGLPNEFEEFLRYCRRLKFAERPDYRHWYQMFQDLAVNEGFPADCAFVWPPPKNALYLHTGSRAKPTSSVDVNRIVQELARMNLGERPVLGNRDNNVVQKPKVQAPEKVKTHDSVAILSSGSEGQKGDVRLTKAHQLTRLALTVRDTTDNLALYRIVEKFTEIIHESRSRTLTKEGFAFLDALYKQLSDPSVYVLPLRTSRRAYEQQENADDGQTRQARLTKMLFLRRDVYNAKSNKQLAQLVYEFGACINNTKNRTITKDAIAFLDGVAETLKALS